MTGMKGLGKLLILLGGIMVVAGLAPTFAGRIPYLGRLPGDIFIQRDDVTVFVPLATMIILSVILTALLNLLPRLFR